MNLFFRFLLALVLALAASASYAQPEPVTEGMVSWQDVKDFQIGPLIPVCEGVDNEYPCVAVDRNDVVWIAWVRRESDTTKVLLASFSEGKKSSEFALSEPGIVNKPVIVCDSKNRLHVAWSSLESGRWSLRYAMVQDGKSSGTRPLSAGSASDRNPAISLDDQERLWVAWESDRDGDRNVYIARVSDKGLEDISKVSESSNEDSAPSLASGPKGAIWVGWHRYSAKGNFDVFIRRLDSKTSRWSSEIQITDWPGMDTFPSIATDRKGRLWIAWQSDESENPDNFTNWIKLRCWDDGNLLEPVAPMPGKDLGKLATDQGFEFPTVHIDGSERVWVFGRPSHNFCAQFYHGESWSPLIRLAKDGWGGRGQYVNVAEDSKGALHLVRRDLNMNALQIFLGLKKEYVEPKLRKVHAISSSCLNSKLETRNLKLFDEAPYSLYFGDLHSHTSLSDGMGSVDELWTRMRDILQWDFAALTDHDDFVGNRISIAEWADMKYLCNRYNQPGTFAAINAYEWTSGRIPNGFGHKNIYFAGDDPPLFLKSSPGSDTAKGLYERIRPLGGLAFPHHIAWTGADWPNFDPEVETCFEIVSNHGVFERMGNEPIKHRGGLPGNFIVDGLAKGFHFGIIGGTDSHGLIGQHGVSYKRDCWRAGLTAVYAKDLTREGILESLRERRCYATTGVRIALSFKADDHLMGESYQTSLPPVFTASVTGVSQLHYVTLVRDGQDVYLNGGDSTYAAFTYKDDSLEPGQHYYYLRVQQRDNEMAWSSPIWIDYRR